MKRLMLAVFAVFSVRGQSWSKPAAYPLARAMFALMIMFLPALAFAQVAAAPAAPQPVWLTVLLGLLPVILGALLAIHPLLKLGSWLHAKAEDQSASTLAKTAFLGAESAAKSLDHFLEISQMDAVDLLDPAKRAAALKHIEEHAKSGALPALADAASSMGAGWVTGAASQAIDAAIQKAPAVAVAVTAAVQAPAPVPS